MVAPTLVHDIKKKKKNECNVVCQEQSLLQRLQTYIRAHKPFSKDGKQILGFSFRIKSIAKAPNIQTAPQAHKPITNDTKKIIGFLSFEMKLTAKVPNIQAGPQAHKPITNDTKQIFGFSFGIKPMQRLQTYKQTHKPINHHKGYKANHWVLFWKKKKRLQAYKRAHEPITKDTKQSSGPFKTKTQHLVQMGPQAHKPTGKKNKLTIQGIQEPSKFGPIQNLRLMA